MMTIPRAFRSIREFVRSRLGKPQTANDPATEIIRNQHKPTLSAVFVGCARNAQPHLSKVLRNIERLARNYDRTAFVFVENDSDDTTKATLKSWLQSKRDGHLIEFDGLAKRLKSRTARLAHTRNAYIEFVRRSKYRTYQHLVILDFDDVNAVELDTEAFRGAISFLERAPEIQGVFANGLPVYYDIWALRHPDWCPTDCWSEIRQATEMTMEQAKERLVYSRQVYIPRNTSPIRVESAFGGLGVYRLPAALSGRYTGTTKDGLEVCEHVSFNLSISKHGDLYIYPPLQNHAPIDHLSPLIASLSDARELPLEQNGRECSLRAPSKHLLDVYRRDHPLYDRRLPLLSQLISLSAPDKCIIDVGANIGDTVALCRLAGCQSPIIAVEPSEQYFAYLEANKIALPELFGSVQTVRAFIGQPGESLALVEQKGTASVVSLNDDSVGPGIEGTPPTLSFDMVAPTPVSLIKTDTDGYDASIILSNMAFIKTQLPVLWVETDTMGAKNEASWQEALADLAPTHPIICIFDNFGFLIAHGPTINKLDLVVDLVGYSRRHKFSAREQSGEPRIYYLDIALFPEQYIDVYHAFIAALPEACL